MKKLLLLLILLAPFFGYSQDTLIKRPIYTVLYSQTLQQPLWLEYSVKHTACGAKRDGMDFFTEKGIITSDDKDYAANEWDKGHMAPAADFCVNRETLFLTFSYLNCALQHYKLNRGVWKQLESNEREWSKNDSLIIRIDVIFDKNSKKLPTGATIPTAFKKTIRFYNSKKQVVYYFKNEPPTKPLDAYLIK
jgi:endonuclease G